MWWYIDEQPREKKHFKMSSKFNISHRSTSNKVDSNFALGNGFLVQITKET